MTSISLGSVIYTAVKPIFKIYFIVGLGFYLGKRNVLTVETSRNISDVVLTAILPSLIFSKVVTNIDNSDIKQIGIICLTGVFLFVSGGIGSYFIYLLTPVPKSWLGGCLSVGFFPNISDLPIAYMQTLDTGSIFTSDEGDKGVAYICIFLAVQLFIQFNLGGYRLVQLDFRRALRQMHNDEEKLSVHDHGSAGAETPSQSAGHSGEGSSEQTINEDDISLTSLSSDDEAQPNYDENDDDEPHSKSSISAPGTAVAVSSTSGDAEGDSSKAAQSTLKNRRRSTAAGEDENAQHKNFLSSHISNRPVSRTRGLSVSQSITSNASYTTSVRNIDLRKMPTQGINDIVNEYSQAENLRTNQPSVTGFTELSIKPTRTRQSVNGGESTEEAQKPTLLRQILGQLLQILENFKRPPSFALVLAIVIAMIPWVKALFVVTDQAHVHNAPDGLPPLSFIMDLTSYIADACVPIGLLLLGATLSRLRVGDMPKGYWKVSLALTCLRLIILPVIGVAFVNKLQRNGWFGDDKVLPFICSINFGLPNATSLIYLTAFYTPPGSDMHLQMDYLSLTYIFQYPALAISLPFLTTFVLKVLLHY